MHIAQTKGSFYKKPRNIMSVCVCSVYRFSCRPFGTKNVARLSFVKDKYINHPSVINSSLLFMSRSNVHWKSNKVTRLTVRPRTDGVKLPISSSIHCSRLSWSSDRRRECSADGIQSELNPSDPVNTKCPYANVYMFV